MLFNNKVVLEPWRWSKNTKRQYTTKYACSPFRVWFEMHNCILAVSRSLCLKFLSYPVPVTWCLEHSLLKKVLFTSYLAINRLRKMWLTNCVSKWMHANSVWRWLLWHVLWHASDECSMAWTVWLWRYIAAIHKVLAFYGFIMCCPLHLHHQQTAFSRSIRKTMEVSLAFYSLGSRSCR